MPCRPAPIEDRFWAKVDKRGQDDCWEWTAARRPLGYGAIGLGGRGSGTILAHRLSWQLANGPISDGMYIDHICHNPPCVNPQHLREVTNKQNHEHLKGAFANSATGIRGVSWDGAKSKYRAVVTHNYKHVCVGRFDTIEEAAAAVKAKRLELFTHNNADRLAS